MKVVLTTRAAPDGSNYWSLTPGREYEVLGIEGDDYRLLDDAAEPILFDPQCFEIIDASEPEFWTSQVDDGVRYAYPPPWGRPGFFEDWHDGIEHVRRLFAEQLTAWYPNVAASKASRPDEVRRDRLAALFESLHRMISTRDLSQLPDVETLGRLLQSLAMLDAILSPEWEFRFYSFNAAWAPGEQMGSMRDGQGDHFFVHFGPAGAWAKGFAHESVMSPYNDEPPRVWPGVLDAVPVEFKACLEEPAFNIDETTFCFWRRPSDAEWQVGAIDYPPGESDPDGSEELLFHLDGSPSTYQQWAEDYYEREVDLAAIEQIFRQQPLTQSLIKTLNPETTLTKLTPDIEEIGYPAW